MGGMVEIFGKSRSFPLIFVYLSRALGWVLGVVGGGLGGFGGDIGGFGGPVRGLEERQLGRGGWLVGWLAGWRRDRFEAPITMVKMGEG